LREYHPHETFIPKGCRAMLIGSFPIAKFSDPTRKQEIKGHEIDFFFGGEKNLLWRLIGDTFGVKLKNRKDIVKLLTEKHIGVGDVIRSCVRREGRSSDKDLQDIEWNTELLGLIRKNRIRKLYFTSRGVEKWFYRLFPEARDLEAITLISPSAQSARALGGTESYKKWRRNNPLTPTYDFILKSYQKAFLEPSIQDYLG
jgi:G:T/U-mismatch repair DNA glycosylase